MRDRARGTRPVTKRVGPIFVLLTVVACGSSSGSGVPGQRPPERPGPEPSPGAETAPDRSRWLSKRAEFVDNCVAGAGPGTESAVATDACVCVFDVVSSRWTPEEFATRHLAIGRELATTGVLNQCRLSAQARR